MKDSKRKNLKGIEIFVIGFFAFFLLAGLWERGISFDDSLLLILGLVCGVVALKKWIIKLLYDRIKNYDKHDEIVSSSISPKYRLISGFIVLVFSVGAFSFMYFSSMVSMFLFGFTLSWFFLGILFFLDSDYTLYRYFASFDRKQDYEQ